MISDIPSGVKDEGETNPLTNDLPAPGPDEATDSVERSDEPSSP